MRVVGQRGPVTWLLESNTHMADMENHTFGFLLGSIAPLVLSPPAAHSGGMRVRGVVQSGEVRARVAFSADPGMRTGVGFDFPLEMQGAPLAVDAAIDWIRTGLASFDELANLHGADVDCHQNRF